MKYISTDWFVDRLVPILLALLAVAFIGYGWYDREQSQTQLQCQTLFNERMADALTVRSSISDEDREATVRMVHEVLTRGTPQERRQALEEYLEAQKRLKAVRDRNPLPELPAACTEE